MADLTQLMEFNRLAQDDAEQYKLRRYLFSSLLKKKDRHFVGIVGPRGVGKTILLKQLARHYEHAFYLSCDTIADDLFELVKQLNEDFGYVNFFIDEIHYQPDFETALKKMYDFLGTRVFFTSSVALAIYHSRVDLSRRVLLTELYPFSFREYLAFRFKTEVPDFTLTALIDRQWPVEFMQYAGQFNGFLKGGIFPFALEESNPLQLLKNIVQTVLYKDIPRVGNVTVAELRMMEKMLTFIGRSSVDGINYSSLSKNLGITKYKAEQYIGYLERAFIIQRVMPKGTNVLREPKVLLSVPYRLLYRSYEDAVGGLREDYFAGKMRSLHQRIHYLKSTRGKKTPDYLIEHQNQNVVIEIGGKGKGREQFKGIETQRKMILTHGNEVSDLHRPLFLLGFVNEI